MLYIPLVHNRRQAANGFIQAHRDLTRRFLESSVTAGKIVRLLAENLHVGTRNARTAGGCPFKAIQGGAETRKRSSRFTHCLIFYIIQSSAAPSSNLT